ncbi:MAG TPA: glycerol kinase GlpK [Thermoplasmata archaeon]|nr:glycerol kinase GlpK [Thermoplasmata archaeon]
MKERYIASIDQGTTGTRFMVFNKKGEEISSAYEEHEQIYPKPGWVEHNPLEIWENTKRVIRKAIEKKDLDPKKIEGIGVTNQRETTLLWDPQTGKPLCNALVWQCTRTRDICQALIDRGLDELVKKQTGLLVNTYFSAPKIKWILDNIPTAREKVERGKAIFGNMDTWLIWKLTGGVNGGKHVTDYTNASRTMLMNLKRLEWDNEILEELNIPRELLPSLRPSSDKSIYGYTKKDGPLGAEIPICGDLGDQQAALFGQNCCQPGEAKNTYGTGCFVLLNTGAKLFISKSGLLTTVAYSLEEGKATYALEGSIAVTGAAIQWLRDNLGLIKEASETEEIAGSVPDSGGVYFVPAFSGLFAPYWDMYARGAIVGLTRFIRKEHLVRATLESICYQTRDVAEAMIADSGVELKSLKVDGGAAKNNFLMQLQADILGVPCIRPAFIETTALGATYCAGLAIGFWENLEELRKSWKIERVFEPKWDKDKREKEYKGWKKAIGCTKNWVDR